VQLGMKIACMCNIIAESELKIALHVTFCFELCQHSNFIPLPLHSGYTARPD
jgi:hypothetical protein